MRTAASFAPFITSGSRGWAKYYAEMGDLFMRITNLDRASIYPDLSDRQHVVFPDSEREGLRTGLRTGDILISITADIGIIGYVDERVPLPAYINQHVACLRLPSDKVCPKFVAYYLASAEPQKRFVEITDVGAKTGINLKTVSNLTFPCPPLHEQQAIAAALSDADGVVAELERLIAKKRLINQGAMQDLLTARRRLPGFSGEWEAVALGAIGPFVGGGTPSMARPEYWKDGTIPWVSSSDVRIGILNGADRFISDAAVKGSSTRVVDPGAILFVTRSGILRRFQPVMMNSVPVAINQDIKALLPRTSNYLPIYVFHAAVASGDQIIRDCMKTGTTVESIDLGALRRFKIRCPKDIQEQQAIAAVLSDLDAEIQTLESRLAKARAIKAGMMEALLTGRIRLSGEVFRGEAMEVAE